MSKKSVYQDINPDALKHFNLDKEPVYGLFVYNKIKDTVVSSDDNVFLDFKERFSSTEEPIEIKNHKKVFVLPNSPVGLERIKEICNEKDLILTNDYAKADLVITHDKYYDYFNGGYYNQYEKMNTKKMLLHINNIMVFNDTNGNVPEVDTYDKGVIYNTAPFIDKPVYLFNGEEDTFYDSYIITPLAINLAYHIEINNVPVITIDNLMFYQAETIILTEELIYDITNMLNNDVEVAMQVIITINFNEKIHFLWELAKILKGKWLPRSKDFAYWEKKSDILEYNDKDPEEMIFYLEKKGMLTKESFKYFEIRCRNQIQIYNRGLYNFKVFIKDRFKDYL